MMVNNLILFCRDLIIDENIRKKQISAADTFFDLLDPLRRVSGNSTQKEPQFVETTPSMIAASAVLDSRKV